MGIQALSHQPAYRMPLYTPVQNHPDASSHYEPGSTADFDRLYRNAYPRVYRTLVAILADPSEAEDCAQDSFVQAFKAWKRWRPDAPAEAWIHRIAVNAAISYRRRARLRSVGEVVKRLGRPSPGKDPADVAAQPDVLGALRTLPPKLAAAIVLRHYHGYNNREIAASLGVSERTVGTRLRQAAEKLRLTLGPEVALGAFSLEAPAALSSRTEQEIYAEP
jgi:RNA polymerase sigma-70 factor (ECF subfamily)